MAVCFSHVGFNEISTPLIRTLLTMVNVGQIIISDIGHTVYITFTVFFETFRCCSLFCTFSLSRNFYSGDAHHDNYGKHSLNHHFQHCAHCVYQIFSVLKLFEIAVCFAHFGFYEISTPLIRTLLTMVNVVQIIISDIGHTVYITFTVFSNFSILQFVLEIWLLRNFYSGDAHRASYGKHSVNHHFQHCAHSVYQIFSVLKTFRNCSLFCTF